jgi:hypothetical protein
MTRQALDLAFWGRVSTEDNQDSESSRARIRIGDRTPGRNACWTSRHTRSQARGMYGRSGLDRVRGGGRRCAGSRCSLLPSLSWSSSS